MYVSVNSVIIFGYYYINFVQTIGLRFPINIKYDVWGQSRTKRVTTHKDAKKEEEKEDGVTGVLIYFEKKNTSALHGW